MHRINSFKDFKPRGIIPLIDLKLERMNKVLNCFGLHICMRKLSLQYTFELRCKQTALPNKVKKQNDYCK